MRKAIWIFVLLFGVMVFAAPLFTPSDEALIESDEVGSTLEDGYFRLTGHVRVKYGDLNVSADEASVNRSTGEYEARGNVTVEQVGKGVSWKAPYVRGNITKKSIQFGPYRLRTPIWHCGGEDGDGILGGDFTVQNGWVSTCDEEEPHYRIQAKSFVIDTEARHFTAKHITLRFGDVPVFYFPWLSGSIDGYSTFIFKPGYSGKKGAYLRLGRIFPIFGDGTSSLFLDLMTKRGVGAGATLQMDRKERAIDVNLYGLYDLDPPETSSGYNRRFKSQDERYRINAYYREELSEGLALRMNLDCLSDIDMLEDWFKRDYRDLRQPRSFIALDWDGGWYDAGFFFRPRVNDFYSVVEQLPELTFHVPRLNIGDTPLEYEGRNLAGYYSMKWRNFDKSRQDVLPEDLEDAQYLSPADYESWRLHTQHFLYLPMEMGSIGVLTPRAGAAVTYYSRSSKNAVTQHDISENINADNPDTLKSAAFVNNYDAKGGEITRVAFETGAEWKTSFQSDWMEFNSSTLRLDGLRHVVEPYLNYTYIHTPSKDRDYIYYFDDLDRLQKQHFVRFGLDQRWQTRAEGRERTFLRLDSYFDLHFDGDDEHGRYPGQWGTLLVYSPWESLRFRGAFVYDFAEGAAYRGETGISYGEDDELHWRLRYMFRNDHCGRSSYSLGSSLVDITGEEGYLKRDFEYSNSIRGEMEFPLNSITWFKMEGEYDFAKGKVAKHTYTLRRQLHCWMASFGIGWDNSDFEVMLMFSLTAFPKVKLDFNL